MVLAEVDRRPKEQVITQWGFKIFPPDDFVSFKEAIQELKPAIDQDKPHIFGSCNFLVPFPIGQVSIGVVRHNDDVNLEAFINPSWLRGEHILNFVQQKSCLKTQRRLEGGISIIEGNTLMEVRTVVKQNNFDVLPPYGEQIIIQTEKTPIDDGWPLFVALGDFSLSTQKFVDSVFAMTGKPCPFGKAISLKFPLV